MPSRGPQLAKPAFGRAAVVKSDTMVSQVFRGYRICDRFAAERRLRQLLPGVC